MPKRKKHYLYKLDWKSGDNDSYTFKKFDDEFNLISEYHVKGADCDCPAYTPFCKHLAMALMFKKGTWPARRGQFYDWDSKRVMNGPVTEEE